MIFDIAVGSFIGVALAQLAVGFGVPLVLGRKSRKARNNALNRLREIEEQLRSRVQQSDGPQA